MSVSCEQLKGVTANRVIKTDARAQRELVVEAWSQGIRYWQRRAPDS